MEFSICFPKDASSPDSGASTPILIFISSEYEMDVSNMSVFLFSEESNWMTGTVIPVDGGYTAK